MSTVVFLLTFKIITHSTPSPSIRTCNFTKLHINAVPPWSLNVINTNGIQTFPPPLNDSPNKCINTTQIQTSPTAHPSTIHPLNLSTLLEYNHSPLLNDPFTNCIPKIPPNPSMISHLMYQHYWNTIIPHPSIVHQLNVSQTSLAIPQWSTH